MAIEMILNLGGREVGKIKDPIYIPRAGEKIQHPTGNYRIEDVVWDLPGGYIRRIGLLLSRLPMPDN